MEEKIDNLYQEYLYKKLDLVFSFDNGEKEFLPEIKEKNIRMRNGYIYWEYVNDYAIVSKMGRFNLADRNGRIVSSYWYDMVWNLSNGLAKVKKDDRYNLINTNGELVCKEWYDDILDFSDGYALVMKNFKYNFIDSNGNILSNKWFYFAKPFNNGFAIVTRNDDYKECNVINTSGEFIYNEWYDEILYLNNDFYAVKKDGKYSIINSKGKLLTNKRFDFVGIFRDNLAIVEDSGLSNFIDINGKFLCDKWYKSVSIFENGLSKVRDGKYFNFIKQNGELLCSKWFDRVGDFIDGFALVSMGIQSNIINTEGKLISDKWFDRVWQFNKDFAIVMENHKYNFINKQGKLISDEWFDEVLDFKNGLSPVKKGDKYNLLDTKGKLVSDKWFTFCFELDGRLPIKVKRDDGKYNYINYEGKFISNTWFIEAKRFCGTIPLALVIREDGKYNYIDTNGNLIDENWFDYADEIKNDVAYLRIGNKKSFIAIINGKLFFGYKEGIYLKKDVIHICGTFIIIDDKVIPTEISLGDYLVKKQIIGYKVYNETISFNIKYQPIKLYGERYMLCLNDNILYLYDRFNNSYKKLSSVLKIFYNDHFIYDKENDIVYFIYENGLIDITKYFKEKLAGEKEIFIRKGIRIEPRNLFELNNSEEIDEVIRSDIRKQRKQDEERSREEKDQQTNKKIEDTIRKEKMEEIELLEAIRHIKLGLHKILVLTRKNHSKNQHLIKSDDIIIPKGDHYIINPLVVGVLRVFDLSSIDFKNVKVEGVDFRETNVDMRSLMNTYNKSLINCNFEGIHIPPFTDFTGVDIRGCRFSNDNNPYTIDVIPNFEDAIYDETTTYNGESVTKLLNNRNSNHI